MIFFTKTEDTKYVTSDVAETSCGWVDGWRGGYRHIIKTAKFVFLMS